MEDRIAILDLIAAYAYMWDGKDSQRWSDLFMDDATWEIYNGDESAPRARVVSRVALRNLAAEHFAGRLVSVQTRHHCNNTVLERIGADSVRGRTMFLVTHHRADEEGPRMFLSGAYEDTFIKTPEGWRFAQRVAYVGGPRQLDPAKREEPQASLR
jgi:hypothetical protein